MRSFRRIAVFTALTLVAAWGQDDARILDLEKRLADQEKALQEQREELDKLKEQGPVSSEKPSPFAGISAGYKDGFFIESEDKNFKLKLNGRIQADARIVEQNHPFDDTFVLRRVRTSFSGEVWKYHEFKIEAEYAGSRVQLTDGYINLKYIPELQFRAGQFKEPFGYEEQASNLFVPTVERSRINSAVAPARDVGFMLHGEIADIFGYQLGLFNGTGANATDVNDDKDVALRLYVNPFKTSENNWIKGLHMGAAATWGHQNTDLEGRALETAVGTDYLVFNDGVEHNDERWRFGTEFAWFVGPFSARAEWMQTQLLNVEQGARGRDITIEGWYATLTFLLTMEDASPKRVKVEKPFNPVAEEFGYGAFELVVRGGQVDTQHSAIRQGFMSGTERVSELTAGFNWWINSNVVFKANYCRFYFDDDIDVGGGHMRGDEDMVLFRLQLDF